MSLATQVATELMAHDDLDAHARDELGITETSQANPLQAAIASALSFALGALLPLSVILFSPLPLLMIALIICTLIGLALLGYVSAKLGGSPPVLSVIRILLWGVFALVATYLIGNLLGVSVT